MTETRILEDLNNQLVSPQIYAEIPIFLILIQTDGREDPDASKSC